NICRLSSTETRSTLLPITQHIFLFTEVPAATAICTLSLHDALPISPMRMCRLVETGYGGIPGISVNCFSVMIIAGVRNRRRVDEISLSVIGKVRTLQTAYMEISL